MKNQEPESDPSIVFNRAYNNIFKWLVMLAVNWAGIYIVLRLLKFA